MEVLMSDECLLILLLSNNKEYIGNNFVNLLKLPFLTQFNKNKGQSTWPMFAIENPQNGWDLPGKQGPDTHLSCWHTFF